MAGEAAVGGHGTEAEVRDAGAHPLQQVIRQPRRHQHPVDGVAGLPRVDVPLHRRHLGGDVQVRVRQHHQRPVAAEFQRQGLEAGRRPRGDLLRHPPGPGERDLRHAGMGGEGLPDEGPVAGEAADEAGRQAGPLRQVAQRPGGEGAWIAGSTTTALPAARAGASFQTTRATGKFQGVIAATTPRAAGRTHDPVASVGPGSCSTHIRSASAAKWWITSGRPPPPPGPRRGACRSRAAQLRQSGCSASTRSAYASNARARPLGGRAAHPGHACPAARTARSASAAVAAATSASSARHRGPGPPSTPRCRTAPRR